MDPAKLTWSRKATTPVKGLIGIVVVVGAKVVVGAIVVVVGATIVVVEVLVDVVVATGRLGREVVVFGLDDPLLADSFAPFPPQPLATNIMATTAAAIVRFKVCLPAEVPPPTASP